MPIGRNCTSGAATCRNRAGRRTCAQTNPGSQSRCTAYSKDWRKSVVLEIERSFSAALLWQRSARWNGGNCNPSFGRFAPLRRGGLEDREQNRPVRAIERRQHALHSRVGDRIGRAAIFSVVGISPPATVRPQALHNRFEMRDFGLDQDALFLIVRVRQPGVEFQDFGIEHSDNMQKSVRSRRFATSAAHLHIPATHRALKFALGSAAAMLSSIPHQLFIAFPVFAVRLAHMRCLITPIRSTPDASLSLRPYTIKLSPQPHAPLALGLSNTNPAVKSSSTQSIVEPTRYSTLAPSM